MSSGQVDEGWGETQSLEQIETEESILNPSPLRLIKQRVYSNPRRPPIVATMVQRMSFYQFQVNSASKSQFSGSNPHYVSNWMLLTLCANMTLGVLGAYYVEVFLGCFARERHLCVSKMVPIAYGIDIVFFFCSIMDLSRFTDLCMTFLDYFLIGIYSRAPWNRCTAFETRVKGSVIDNNNRTLEFLCLDLPEFKELIFKNRTSLRLIGIPDYSCYVITEQNKCVQIVQTLFIEDRISDLIHSRVTVMVYAVILWLGCVLTYKQIYHRLLWKLMFYADVLFCSMYLVVLIHVSLFPDDTEQIFVHKIRQSRITLKIWAWVELMSACFVFSPPMVYYISARSKKVNPSLESLGMALSTVGHTLFFIITNFKVQNHVFSKLGGLNVEMHFTSTFSYLNMDFWLIYFGTMAAGNFFCLIFLFINFVMEYVSMILTFACIIEIYTSEFRYGKRWMTVSAVFVLSFFNYLCLSEERSVLQFFGRLIVMIGETVATYFFYTLSRLLDDIQFHFGQEASKMRYFSILVSVIVEMMLYTVTVCFVRLDSIVKFYAEEKFSYSAVYLMLLILAGLPLVGGAFWVVFKYLVIKKKNWTLLFVPLDDWGPSAFVTRQLRKQFQSRKFIASQAPRVLSRYLMKNKEPETYKLDIVYEFSAIWRAMNSLRNR